MPVRRSESGRPRDRQRYRRVFRWALAVAVAVHAILLALLVLPSPHAPETRRSLHIIPMPALVEELPRRESPTMEEPAVETDRPTPPAVAAAPSVPVPVESPEAPESRTMPETSLTAPLLPLEVGPDRRIRRRARERDPAELARMRAESLVNARLAALPGAGVPKERGAVSLAEGGGVTIAVPWQGFLPGNRQNDTWRRERCEGKDSGEADKPGEAEARRSQCG